MTPHFPYSNRSKKLTTASSSKTCLIPADTPKNEPSYRSVLSQSATRHSAHLPLFLLAAIWRVDWVKQISLASRTKLFGDTTKPDSATDQRLHWALAETLKISITVRFPDRKSVQKDTVVVNHSSLPAGLHKYAVGNDQFHKPRSYSTVTDLARLRG